MKTSRAISDGNLTHWRPGQSGNPNGRPKGSQDRRTRNIQATLDRLGFDPFEKKVRLAQAVEEVVVQPELSLNERREWCQLYADVLRDLLQYSAPKLKSVSHTGQITILQKLTTLASLPDAELDALIADAEALLAKEEAD